MKKNLFLVSVLLSMVFLGLQMAEPVAAAHPKLIDTFKVYHPGGQGGDMTKYNVYKYSTRHVYVKSYEYVYNAATGRYTRVSSSWEDIYKFKNSNLLKMTSPNIEDNGVTRYWFNTHWNDVGFYKYVYKPNVQNRVNPMHWQGYVSTTST
ncbi:MAG: hypothetical protein HZC47_00890 [Methanobacterium sp.]|uniref:hypothetical protein n=1 Tax=Methanobacterium sp. TaxID=2164 RepID=UPI003D660164|nr:hypothetical protein [Methanobacterium sp.]